MQQVLAGVISGIEGVTLDQNQEYFHLLPLYHEYMHSEALTYTRQTLGYPTPQLRVAQSKDPSGAGPLIGDAEVPGGSFYLGGMPDEPFVFDNEKWAHAVDIAPFKIARA